MANVGWINIVIAGWPVLSVLLVMSIVTFAIAYERWKIFKRIQSNSPVFFESLQKTTDTQKILSWCDNSDQPLAFITQKVYRAHANREDRERVLHRSILNLVQNLEKHVSILGTIASVAPFVGLLGTVLGIIKAFRAVSMASTAGAGLVAVGISEALVGTAGGLIVAIPALLFYNYFVNKIRHFTQDWELAGSDIIDHSLGHRSH